MIRTTGPRRSARTSDRCATAAARLRVINNVVRSTDVGAASFVNLVGTADENGVLSVTLVADPTRNTGAYEITSSAP